MLGVLDHAPPPSDGASQYEVCRPSSLCTDETLDRVNRVATAAAIPDVGQVGKLLNQALLTTSLSLSQGASMILPPNTFSTAPTHVSVSSGDNSDFALA